MTLKETSSPLGLQPPHQEEQELRIVGITAVGPVVVWGTDDSSEVTVAVHGLDGAVISSAAIDGSLVSMRELTRGSGGLRATFGPAVINTVTGEVSVLPAGCLGSSAAGVVVTMSCQRGDGIHTDDSDVLGSTQVLTTSLSGEMAVMALDANTVAGFASSTTES